MTQNVTLTIKWVLLYFWLFSGYEWSTVPDIRQVLLDWDVVDPGFELRVEELLPFVPNMKDERATEEEMFEAKACSHTPEVE